jgi:prepilin-type N-terminal cleavage/methylation domain-containing protein
VTLNRSTPLKYNTAGAFTLVEVLVVLVLISILSGMVMTAVQGVTSSARLARTRSIIAIIDSVVQEQYESYKYRPLPVVIPDASAALPSGVFSLEILPNEAARVRLNMIRDLQRMELPDRISDIRLGTAMNRPVEIYAAASRVSRVENPPGSGRFRFVRENEKTRRITRRVEWFGMTAGTPPVINDVPSRFSAYYTRATPGWTEQHQGAECLYMIMATSFVGGAPAIEMIPASNIGDVDGDGMPEILDGWGQPIEFIRWPVGYEDPELSVDSSILDDFDPLRTDFGFIVNETTPPNVPDIPAPWSVRPLVISAGGDREFGINFSALNSAGAAMSFRYSASSPTSMTPMLWPMTPAAMGDESGGRVLRYFFVDPFLRQISGVAQFPGSPKAGPIESSYRADNITNYQLAASE